MKSKINLMTIFFFVLFSVSTHEVEAGKKAKQTIEDSDIAEKPGCFSCFRGLFGGSKKNNDIEQNEIDIGTGSDQIISVSHNEKDDDTSEEDDNPPSYTPPLVPPANQSSSSNDNKIDIAPIIAFQNTLFKTHECMKDCHQKVFVLSLDGGGIRGVILARILIHIAEMMNVPINQLFNLIAGTSTGGLIALALSMPDDDNPTLARFNPAQILNQYLTKKEEIFKKRSIIHLPGILESMYDPSGIETFCKETFTKHTKLSQLLVPAFVTAFNDTDNNLEIFGSHSAFLSDAKNERVWKAGRITSAAPFYFTSVLEDGDIYRDGGLSANNPSEIALAEIRRLFPNKAFEDIIVISIGTGENINEKIKIDLAIPDIQKIIKQFEQGQLAAVDRTMESFLGNNYIRIQTELIGDLKTDDIHEDYIQMMLDCAAQTIAKNEAQFERLKSLWFAQYQNTGTHKHVSPYDEWQKIQRDIMEAEGFQSANLSQIQEAYYKNHLE
ncbi:MAG: patatin-like phospholipase family protein [Alphaproteobacteria bacterium]|nr:patatin-like phospholipase family protein [Alphaproteobacteria bacterium]